MTDSSPSDRPPRRPRYRGRHPRHFAEKYKEHQPERYPDAVAKVAASGKTPAGTHRPILVAEILEALAVQPGDLAVDCTLGYGGHARELLARVQPGGRLIALDVDPVEGPRAEARLRGLGFPEESLLVVRRNFAGLYALLLAEAPEGADAILADLGISSMQIDDPARGFTFKDEGPLDMRMDPTRGQPASALVAGLHEAGLARLLAENADEPRAVEVAHAIVRARGRAPLLTTQALADVVRSAYPRSQADAADDAVRRVFQALRIAVNDEFGALDAFLRTLPGCLKPGGRVALMSFHSGEDRRVKAAFQAGLQAGLYRTITKDLIRAGPEERRANPRSTSAKLRIAVRAGEPAAG